MRKTIHILFILILILLASNFYIVFAVEDDSLTPISFQYIWASEEYDQAPMFNDIVVIYTIIKLSSRCKKRCNISF